MRLSKIKLAGFKSFVDPTTIQFPSNLTGIVGPNGCGKSNVIDAVRWVMGETSAKNLRGDSMADVIFNGSSERKPVGNASIELIFDNSDGTVGGQYANYSEISIRRVVSRDGTSVYSLNNARCRRKDITSIFLGTGLGPRSYSIIEQGMISRLIESRPEELRVFLEEAAGISKYKERRRETENRIRHTRDNLERLHDLMEEVENQIKHLQRQSRTAERYKKLKGQERKLGAELLALKLRHLDEQASQARSEAADVENRLQKAISSQRSIETEIEKLREGHNGQTDVFNEVQGRYYKVGAEIARFEQSIQHARELKQRQETDLERALEGLKAIETHIEQDQHQLSGLAAALDELGPDLDQARDAERVSMEALHRAEMAMQNWQQSWENFSRDNHDAQNQVQVQKERIEHLDTQLTRLVQQRDRIHQEQQTLNATDGEAALTELVRNEHHAEVRSVEAQKNLQDMSARIAQLRDEDQQLTRQLDSSRADVQKLRGQLASLEAMQQAALGQAEGEVSDWLAGESLADKPRLAQQLDVESGCERIVETVLGSYLEAVCVDGIDAVGEILGGLKSGSVAFVEQSAPSEPVKDASRLLSKIRNQAGLEDVLGGVYLAESLAQALSFRQRLGFGESVVTRDGIWIGRQWLRVARDTDEQGGVIRREQQMREQRDELDNYCRRVERQESSQANVRKQLAEFEENREAGQTEYATVQREFAEISGQVKAVRLQAEQTAARARRLQQEQGEVGRDSESSTEQVKASRADLERGLEMLAGFEDHRTTLEMQKKSVHDELDRGRERSKKDQLAAQEIAIKVESRRSSQESASANLTRMQAQLTGFKQRADELSGQLEQGDAPLADQQQRLATELDSRVKVEQELADARRELETLEQSLRDQEQGRLDAESKVESVRQAADRVRMTVQEIKVRREGIAEQFDATEFEFDELVVELDEDANVEQWAEQLEKTATHINRLGPINLAAIEEFKEQTERKDYLDAQNSDLTEALETLETAIRKIDRETRTRFKETFDRVNAGLKQKFPRLFGGGHAYLELTGDDLLSSGVTVMARPPGKRNSTIHLLSGGEKALTAVAMVFSIFDLNPAPFCLLDEVDAPLDDTNVGRFCEIVRDMSDQVQFVVITHNKATMEMMNQLTGVTMHEAGVSRLVSVDVDEAVKMAAM